MGEFVSQVFTVGSVLPPPAPPSSGASALVESGWADAHDYADRAFTAATTFLNELQAAALALDNLPYVDSNLTQITLDISGLDALIGVAPVSPNNTAVFTDQPYTSAYLNDLRTLLDSWVNGASTGLDPTVEQAIWDRARSREIVASNVKAKEAFRSFAMRGFTKPPGMLSIEVQDAVQETQNNIVTASREVMIKQADLEQSNRRFAMEEAWKVEEGMITYLNQQMARSLDYAKTVQDFITKIYAEQITAYDTQAKVYTAKVNAETEVFKAEVNANVAEASIRIEASKANVQIMIQQASILVEMIKGGAQVAAQLAASALSSVNLSGQISDHTSVSASISNGNSFSQSSSTSNSAHLGEDHTYKEK
jgi:hypothetical protein